MINRVKLFTSPGNVQYSIDDKDSGKFEVWMYSNPLWGWRFKGEFNTFEEAKQFMISIDPSQNWNP